MSDQKISALTADASPTSTDLTVTVDDPSGTPVNKKVTLGNLVTKAHGLSDGLVKVATGTMTVVAATTASIAASTDKNYVTDAQAVVIGNTSGTNSGDNAVNSSSQPLNSGLTTIAGLTATTDNFIQSKSSAWASRTVSQVKTDLGLTGTNSGDQTITLTGDVTGSGTGSFAATIGTNKVTNAQLAQVSTATIKGRTTAGTGNPEDLTATQATAILNEFTGDAGSGGLKGLVKAPVSGDATKFLKGDGTWATPSGSSSPLTTKGDVYTFSTVDARLGVGTNGQVLTADSTAGTGIKWANPAGGGDALTASPLSQFAATTSAQLAGVISDETGTDKLVFNTSPTLVTPLLGTPTSGVLTNCTGTASGLTAGNVTTNANLTGPITSIGNATSIASQTGTGTKFVVDTSPTLVTPVLGVATATSLNKVTVTAPATSATLTISDGKTLSATNTLTLSGTDSTVMTFPSTSATMARSDAANTFAGIQTITNLTLPTNGQVLLTVPTSDGHATGPTTNTFNSGYSSSAVGDLVYLDSSATWQKTDANTVALYNGILGIALEVKSSGQALLVALPGSFVYSTAFPTFTIGSPVYMSETAGAVTGTAPVTTDAATRVIGWGVHADKLYFYPSQDYHTHT